MTINNFNGRSRRTGGSDVAAGIIVVLFILVLIPFLAALSALFTMLAWNLGVVALVAACGGAVAKIGFVTAIFVNIAIGIIGCIFRRPEVKASS